VKATIAKVEKVYATRDAKIDRTDGISVDYADWRFNLRGSNTEPVLRLNVESRANEALMKLRTAEILKLIDSA
jgi:phosphomannomutase